jgi:hypothetical protein
MSALHGFGEKKNIEKRLPASAKRCYAADWHR